MSVKRKIGAWLQEARLPENAKVILRQDHAGLTNTDPGCERIIEEGVAWLCRAQDHSATRDGGVARHYSLMDGWGASYPETTGYIVPTLIARGQESGNSELIDRARRMLDWLVSIQYREGGFQGGMIDQAPRVPVVFNTGQILLGLAAGAAIDPRYCDPLRKAADWLLATQDSDGCWRRHASPFAAPGEKTYETHVALSLVCAAKVQPGRGYAEAALKQVDWALTHQLTNGWLARCCLTDPERPLTHTLGYALRGIIGAYSSSSNDRYLHAACRMADGLINALGPGGMLPGRLDSQWRKAADWVCLTGTSQIAQCWLLLYRVTGRNDYLRAGCIANAYVRRTVALEGSPGVRGGVKGSFPIDGAYGRWQYLSWACKFTIDSNRDELAALRR